MTPYELSPLAVRDWWLTELARPVLGLALVAGVAWAFWELGKRV